MKFGLFFKIFASSLLLTIYIASPFKLFVPYLSYQLNYKYISGTLCENINKPEMHCNGKCHLQKQLKKTAAEEAENKSKVKAFHMEEIIPRAYYGTFESLITTNSKTIFHYLLNLVSCYSAFVAPPPKYLY